MFKKIRFYKALLIEIVETLCTISIYLAREARCRQAQTKEANHFLDHYDELKKFSEIMRGYYGEQDKDRVV